MMVSDRDWLCFPSSTCWDQRADRTELPDGTRRRRRTGMLLLLCMDWTVTVLSVSVACQNNEQSSKSPSFSKNLLPTVSTLQPNYIWFSAGRKQRCHRGVLNSTLFDFKSPAPIIKSSTAPSAATKDFIQVLFPHTSIPNRRQGVQLWMWSCSLRSTQPV